MNNTAAHPTHAMHSARILRRQQGLQALEQGRPLEAAALLRAALDEGIRLGEHDEAHLGEWMLLGDALAHGGQLEDALEAYSEALDFLRGPVFANPVGSYARGLKMRARAYRVEYLYQRVDCEMDCLSERARTHSLLLRRIARLECALGRLESGLLRLWEAQFLLEHLLECDVLLERLALDLEGAGVLTRLGDRLGARAVVYQTVSALGFLESGSGAHLLGQAHRLLGQLCWSDGDLEQAGRHLSWALESFRTAGRPAEVAHAEQDLARVLAERGDFAAACGHLECAGESVSLRRNPLEAYRLDHA